MFYEGWQTLYQTYKLKEVQTLLIKFNSTQNGASKIFLDIIVSLKIDL